MSDSASPVSSAASRPDSPAELLERYRKGGELLRISIAGLGAEAIRERPVLGKMSSLEVVRHIVDADQFMCDRMKRTIATERPVLIGVESVDYLEPLDYQGRDPELDLRLLDVQRRQMAADLEQLPDEVWQRTALHSEVGVLTLRQLLNHAVCHLEEHVASIAEKRVALGL